MVMQIIEWRKTKTLIKTSSFKLMNFLSNLLSIVFKMWLSASVI